MADQQSQAKTVVVLPHKTNPHNLTYTPGGAIPIVKRKREPVINLREQALIQQNAAKEKKLQEMQARLDRLEAEKAEELAKHEKPPVAVAQLPETATLAERMAAANAAPVATAPVEEQPPIVAPVVETVAPAASEEQAPPIVAPASEAASEVPAQTEPGKITLPPEMLDTPKRGHGRVSRSRGAILENASSPEAKPPQVMHSRGAILEMAGE